MIFNFTTCNKRRDVGPTQAEIDSCYLSTSTKVKILGSGIQKWIVPYKGSYLITAVGASGDATCSSQIGGTGVEYSSLFNLNKNDILYIIAGQQGFSTGSNLGGSGGGASYVAKKVKSNNYSFSLDSTNVLPLLVAAGGGGAGDCNTNGVSPKDGDPGHCETLSDEGGETGQPTTSGGAGFFYDSKKGTAKSFINGGIGSYQLFSQDCYSYGSFGGGGNADDGGGGGGGYRGGASGALGIRGFGGYSYNNGKKISCRSNNFGSGFVLINFLGHNKQCMEKCRPTSHVALSLIIVLIWK